MYEKVQKRSSDWNSTSAQKLSQSQYGSSSFSVQRQSNKKSNPPQERREYSTAARDSFAAKIMRTLAADGLREEPTPKQISESVPNSDAPATTETGVIQQQQKSGSNNVMLPIQVKLTIGEPGDKYEQEADRVAEQVMRMPDPEPLNEAFTVERQATGSVNPMSISRQKLPGAFEVQPIQEGLQRKCAACEEDEQAVQMKPSLQRIAADGSSQASNDIESQLSRSKGGGSPLSDEVRSFMEPRIGADFSQVRVHTDSSAVQMNQELSAQAFTHKQDIYFGAGKAPAKDVLTAHELTHVVQQTSDIKAKNISEQSTVRLKCSACENEGAEVQRSPDISVVSKPEIQRWSLFGDDEDKQESEGSSGGGVLDWAKEKASGAIGSVTQAGSDAYDWAKEKGGAAVDTVTQAGSDAYNWAKETGEEYSSAFLEEKRASLLAQINEARQKLSGQELIHIPDSQVATLNGSSATFMEN